MSGTISVENISAAGTVANNTNEKVIFKNCAPFTDCISEINNTQISNAKDIDMVILVYNWIQYSDNYLKTSGSLWQYYRDELSINNVGGVIYFTSTNHK